MTLRLLIVDDEPLARERVRTLLTRYPRLTVIGECRDGLEAVAAVRRGRVDLMILDIQMPALDGFGVLANLRPKERPVTVFITAFDEYAVRAFEIGAADYVMKPIQPDRFAQAVERAMDRIAAARRGPHRDFEPVFRQLHADGRWLDRFLVERHGSMLLVPVADVVWLEAAGNYVRLHTRGGPHLIRSTLREVETQLDPERFLRVHRSTIVAVDHVHSVSSGRHGEAVVTLSDRTTLTAARGRAAELRKRLRGL